MKVVKYVLSIIFLLYTGVLIVMYIGMLYLKIDKPEMKNLNLEGFFLSGLFAAFLVFLDYLLIKWLYRNLSGNKASNPI
ncbi:hypothetical protein AHMF7616_02022 [Adhaeribacter pallidiroseus]|uniref:Uncharacterized protein n=1 Tax=Adhaeribacter pallidiroseus TaxID=2072847 RepID=A0A369QKP3_9BACT|nr:hypothetical protein AHMF7616_02022 [Adhaeribacter pallidiroseus]